MKNEYYNILKSLEQIIGIIMPIRMGLNCIKLLYANYKISKLEV